jgi:hypothetical protein
MEGGRDVGGAGEGSSSGRRKRIVPRELRPRKPPRAENPEMGVPEAAADPMDVEDDPAAVPEAELHAVGPETLKI